MSDMETGIMPQTSVSIAVDPKEATHKARNAGVYLLKLLDQKDKKVVINKKRYMEFEDWITLGNYYGLAVETGDAEPVEIFGAKGFKAKAKVIRIEDGLKIGGAEAYCLNNERNWENKDLFQLASMAQTRAGSKALSNELRWVAALAGIQGTPAEEMESLKDEKKGKQRTSNSSSKGKSKTIKQDDGSELEPPVSDMSKDGIDWDEACSKNAHIAKYRQLLEDTDGEVTADNVIELALDDGMKGAQLGAMRKILGVTAK